MLYFIFAGSRATKATANQTNAVMKQEDMKRTITKKNDSILVGLDLLSTSKTGTPMVPKRSRKNNASGICTPMVLRSQRRSNKFRVYFKSF